MYTPVCNWAVQAVFILSKWCHATSCFAPLKNLVLTDDFCPPFHTFLMAPLRNLVLTDVLPRQCVLCTAQKSRADGLVVHMSTSSFVYGALLCTAQKLLRQLFCLRQTSASELMRASHCADSTDCGDVHFSRLSGVRNSSIEALLLQGLPFNMWCYLCAGHSRLYTHMVQPWV